MSSFMSPLSERQRVAVSNLNPLIYDVIIKEKQGEDAPTVVLADSDERVLDWLRRLDVADTAKVAESVRSAIRGDQAASRGAAVEAARQYQRAAETNPYNDLALMSWGVALARQGKLREGIRWVEKALEVNPDNERARGNLRAMQADL